MSAVEVRFGPDGLAPCVMQDGRTGEVLTLAWINAEALRLTRETGEMHFFSRSRRRIWHKGEESGNTMRVLELRIDCDEDAIVALVEPAGPACHTGERSCFYRGLDTGGEPQPVPGEALAALSRTIESRLAERPEGSYVVRLLDDPAFAGGKVREEAEEVDRAVREESDERVAEEAADVLFHLTALIRSRGITLDRVGEVLNGRRGSLADRLAPDREAARALTPEANVVPLSLTYTDDCETPVSALLKLGGRGPAFLLESAERGQVGRYSFVGTDPHRILRWRDGTLREYGGDAVSEAAPELGSAAAPDPYRGLKEHLSRYRVAELPGMPPFAGGVVGLFGYDLVRAVEPLGEPPADPLGLPDLALMVTDVLLAFDHLHNRLTIIACAWLDDHADFDAAWDAAAAKIAAVRERLLGPVPIDPRARVAEPPAFESNLTRERFEGIVARIVEYIRRGDAFQVVPSQRFSAEARADALSIYRGLRAINPSPYMYFLEFGDFQIAGASPEPLLKVNGDRVEIRPIAGTSPRGASEEEDRRLAEQLISDPKERAEHVMLVDLARNDIGREAIYGTVRVEELMVVETYSHVMHIVSRVTGRLPADRGALDVLRSALPAGTLSGAPKVRAMQIIDEVEPVKRSFYGGAVGYLAWNGDLDTAIHIRTAIIKDGRVHIQAGGGTVFDARPENEYRESVNKAKAMFRAVEMACENPDWA